MGYLGASDRGHEGPAVRDHPGKNISKEWFLLSAAASEKPGALDVIVSLLYNRSGQPRDFARVILTISRHDNDESETIFERVLVSLSYGIAYSVPGGILDRLDWNSYLPTGLFDCS